MDSLALKTLCWLYINSFQIYLKTALSFQGAPFSPFHYLQMPVSMQQSKRQRNARVLVASHCSVLREKKEIKSGFSSINEGVVISVSLQNFLYPYWVLSSMLSAGDYI